MTAVDLPEDPTDLRARRIRARNRALLLVLLGLVGLFYVLTFVRMGAH
ncbi:MAG: hypothetical protein JO032_06940 [Alphaproteobacteria bacterium]|nr:hypothetical protein [Alphaproteobacteria bacterium]